MSIPVKFLACCKPLVKPRGACEVASSKLQEACGEPVRVCIAIHSTVGEVDMPEISMNKKNR